MVGRVWRGADLSAILCGGGVCAFFVKALVGLCPDLRVVQWTYSKSFREATLEFSDISRVLLKECHSRNFDTIEKSGMPQSGRKHEVTLNSRFYGTAPTILDHCTK